MKDYTNPKEGQNEIDEIHGIVDKEERKKAHKHWCKLDVATKAHYMQIATSVIGPRKNFTAPQQHIGRIVAYAMKTAYATTNSNAHVWSVMYY